MAMRRATPLLPLVFAAVALMCAAQASATEPVTAQAGSQRTSWYPDEPQLTPQLLEAEGAFAQNFAVPVQGQVYAQPLVSGHTLLVATEDDWVYGIDSRSGEVKWERKVGTPWNSADLGCGDLAPHVGVTGTPVVDPNTNTAYFLAKSYEGEEQSGPAVWKMHAVDLASGGERPGFPVTIEGEAENLPVVFEPTHQLQRPALLLMNGVVYAGFGGHCDISPFHGWIVGVSTAGQIRTMWATTEEGHNGAAIWMGGGGIVSDGEGQLLFATGNSWSPSKGPGNQPHEGHLGDSVVRAQIEPDGALKPTEFFSPYNNVELDAEDLDLGSSAPLPLPSPWFGTEATPDLAVQVGKGALVYLLNRDELGGMGQGPEGKNADLGETPIENGVWGSLATWPGDGGYVYIPASGEEPGNGALEFLKYGVNGLGAPELTPVARATGLEFGSGSPIVTSNGATPGSGIVWISHCPQAFECKGSTLDAYAAVPGDSEPQPLWSGEIGVSTKFARPLASGGRIYVGARDGRVLAFGPTHHTLTVVRETASGGSVQSDVGGIECGSVCSRTYENGAQVTLTATPAAHYEFAGWAGGECSGTATCQLTMYSDVTVTASFVPITHELTVTKAGAGEGTVVSRPIGIDCGITCSARFPETNNVVLEALPGRNAVTWSGCTSAAGRVCEVDDLESNRGVSVSFLPLPDTRIAGAKIDKRQGKATFRLRGTEEAQRFQCRLIGPADKRHRPRPRFASCGKTKTFKHLAPGRYTLEARAINSAGVDPTPAKRRFKI
ncbi:MAG: InlB B-repeat-containing protein [Solirubrobacterales bacterium]